MPQAAKDPAASPVGIAVDFDSSIQSLQRFGCGSLSADRNGNLSDRPGGGPLCLPPYAIRQSAKARRAKFGRTEGAVSEPRRRRELAGSRR